MFVKQVISLKTSLENVEALDVEVVRWSPGRRKRALSEAWQREDELGLVSARKGRKDCWFQSSPEFPSYGMKLLCCAKGRERPETKEETNQSKLVGGSFLFLKNI